MVKGPVLARLSPHQDTLNNCWMLDDSEIWRLHMQAPVEVWSKYVLFLPLHNLQIPGIQLPVFLTQQLYQTHVSNVQYVKSSYYHVFFGNMM